MSYTYGPVRVKGTSTRNTTANDGTELQFVSIYTDGGEYAPRLWAFASDLPTLPEKGTTCTFDVAIRAKASNDPQRPRLSVRVLSFKAAE